jgi:glyoxylase-like metal-dependent hydrolase (beta-lactamase superfamily II)
MSLDLERITAPNPGVLTLEGTNTYIVSRPDGGGAIVIDPGPADEGHIARVRAAAEARGGVGAVLLTHHHGDHSDGVALLGVEPSALGDGESEGPLTAIATPGHAVDHLCFVAGGEAFVGDLIAGVGSSIVPPREYGGSLHDYMDSLRQLESLDLELMHPGHGPDITDPPAKIGEYLGHRQEREDKLLAALEAGERDREKLLDAAWEDVAPELRPMAEVAMRAHLEKLEDEDRLPADMTEGSD